MGQIYREVGRTDDGNEFSNTLWYKRVRGEKGKLFHYRDIKKVYTIVFFERSEKEFHHFPGKFLHRFKQTSDTGLEIELLQEYLYITLDIYKKNMENKSIETDLEAWLAFLSFDDPKRIIELIKRSPVFGSMYQDIYEVCMNIEKVMNLYSKELEMMDRNTVHYMIDEMQAEIDRQRETITKKDALIQKLQIELEASKQQNHKI